MDQIFTPYGLGLVVFVPVFWAAVSTMINKVKKQAGNWRVHWLPLAIGWAPYVGKYRAGGLALFLVGFTVSFGWDQTE